MLRAGESEGLGLLRGGRHLTKPSSFPSESDFDQVHGQASQCSEPPALLARLRGCDRWVVDCWGAWEILLAMDIWGCAGAFVVRDDGLLMIRHGVTCDGG